KAATCRRSPKTGSRVRSPHHFASLVPFCGRKFRSSICVGAVAEGFVAGLATAAQRHPVPEINRRGRKERREKSENNILVDG
ncbi:MAG TPA: hypothetical protein VMJ12_12325, partial [Candidatus Acidoferrales bacterium]|nr:hypothetical protein [Candidatus Acidoferrales bacterium]